MRLTENAIRTAKLPADKSEAIFFDDDIPGFGLRVRAGGSRTFVFQYKLGAKHRRMALGSASALTVARVRKTAEELYHRVKLGHDPASDKAEAQREASETFGPLAEQLLETLQARYRPGSFREIKRHLTKYAKPLHHLQVAKIGLRDVAGLLDSITKKSGTIAANRCRTSLSVFFSWAIQSGRIETNPVINTQKNDEQSRDRVLLPAELRLIWNALEDDHYGAIVKLLALTGQRAGEIAGLRWSEIHDGQIVFPAERVKNRRVHVLPLSDAAATIIAQQRIRDGRDLLFGRNSQHGFYGWSYFKELLDQRITAANGGKALPGWRLHDLRRTCATKMVELGIRPDVVEAVLNHASGQRSGVAGIYNRHSYDREKRQALDLWADKLIAIVSGLESTVTPLRREA
jgi:integrase